MCIHLYPTLCEPMDFSVLQAFLSMEFSRQRYQSELPFSPPGDLPDPGIKTTSLVSPSLAGRFFTNCATWEAHIIMFRIIIYYLCFYSVG